MPSPLIPIGHLIDQSWETFRERKLELLSISGWMLVTAILDIVALSLYPNVTKLATGGMLSSAEIAGTVLFAFTSMVVAPVIGLWVWTAMVRYLRGPRANVRTAMQEGWKYFLSAAWVSILLQLVMFGGLAIGFGPGIVLLALGWVLNNTTILLLGNFLIVIGVFIATIVCVRWFIAYVMAPYALLLDDVHGRAALVESKKLTEGRFFAVLARYAIPKVFFVVVGVVLMAVLSYVSHIMLSAAAGLNLDVQLRLLSISNTVIPIILTALLNPLIILSDVLLYNSLKGR